MAATSIPWRPHEARSAGLPLHRHQAKPWDQALSGEIPQSLALRLVELERAPVEEKGHDAIVASTGVPHRTLLAIDDHFRPPEEEGTNPR
jgi:hypothetical protein